MVRYIHFFWHSNTEFAGRIVRMINDADAGFVPAEHMFVTVHKNVYDSIKEYPNTQYINTDIRNYSSIVKTYSSQCRLLIFHSIFRYPYSLKIDSKTRKKIVWRTWGHDVGYNFYSDKHISNVVKRIIEIPWRHEVRSFKAVAIANEIDRIDVYRRFKANNTVIMPYPVIREIDNNKSKFLRKEGDVINVLVGHSGYPFDNHIQIIERINKYGKRPIKLYFIMSYGDKTYIKMLKDRISQLCLQDYTIIEEYMDSDRYVEFLSKMDIAVFDGIRSYALGNISLLLSMRKKLFLNPKGVISEAFSKCDIPFSSTFDIGQQSYEEFIKMPKYSSSEYPLESHSYMWGVNRWHELLKELG